MKSQKSGRRRNPMGKRIPRELRHDWRRYMVIFLFMTLIIGFVSGMYVANGSMSTSIDSDRAKNNLENGKMTFKHEPEEEILSAVESGKEADVRTYYMDKAEKAAIRAVEKDGPAKIEEETRKQIASQVKAQGLTGAMAETMTDQLMAQAADQMDSALKEAKTEAVKEARDKAAREYDRENSKDRNKKHKTVPVTLYNLNYKDLKETASGEKDKDVTVRVFKIRDKVDRQDVLKGSLPENDDEIAIDRMHAENSGIEVGDTITVGGSSMKVTGLISLPDFTSLYKNNSDVMFDALTFDVAVVNDAGFDALQGNTKWCYAWKYKNQPADDKAENSLAESLTRTAATQALVNENELTGFVPGYTDQAVVMAYDDLNGDMAIVGLLLIILTVVIAFVFAVTISNSIQSEATVIGTLRASGYTRGELIRHYMALPAWVAVISAIVGNVLGYTCMKNLVASMYYHSYSFPTYHTIWSGEAFWKTTLIPVALMIVINYLFISRKLSLSPMKFMRKDLSRNSRKRALKLTHGKFMHRFRLRVLLQNIPNYIVLFAGVFFVMLMLVFAMGFSSSLRIYQEDAPKHVLAEYQYMLVSNQDKNGDEIKTKNSSAEKAAITELETKGGARDKESITVYGVSTPSRYVKDSISSKKGSVVVSRSYAEKFRLQKGDRITLKEKYTDDIYHFTVSGISKYTGGMAVFMNLDNFNSVFDNDEDYFNAFFSDTAIKDINKDYIATTVTSDDMMAVARQLDYSVGFFMVLFRWLCVLLAIALLYLLTKVIIERNSGSISMTKIIGYTPIEIARLYLVPTMFVVIFSEIVSIILNNVIVTAMWRMYLNTVDGWIFYTLPVSDMLIIFAMVFAAYVIITLIDYRRIRRIPMTLVLKNVQ